MGSGDSMATRIFRDYKPPWKKRFPTRNDPAERTPSQVVSTRFAFTPFRQESEGLSREYEGSGLGLAVTRQVLDQMEGTIDVETEPEQGTCFTVWLPAVDEKRLEEAA